MNENDDVEWQFPQAPSNVSDVSAVGVIREGFNFDGRA